LSRAILLRPGDPHLLFVRGAIHRDAEQWEPAIADMEAALAKDPVQPALRESLAECYYLLGQDLAKEPKEKRDWRSVIESARRAVELAPNEWRYLHRFGVRLCRAGRFAESTEALQRSLAAGHGQGDGFDLFFLALANHGLGRREAARAALDRGVRWVNQQTTLGPPNLEYLNRARAEAEAALAGSRGELPEDVFALPRQKN
jgi:tetratricopeptide (TPR) repeat protein